VTHADDVFIMGRRLQDVEEVFTWLVEQTNNKRLVMNGRKTKFVIEPRKTLQRKWIFKVGTYNFEMVKDFYISWYNSKKQKLIITRDWNKNYDCKYCILCTSSCTKEPIAIQSRKIKIC